jgi:hypothetical protein
MRSVLITIGVIVGLFALVFASNEFEIFGIKLWGVRKANAQREVFEQTQSYIEGKRQELIKLHHEWINANSDSKISIEATIRMCFSNFNEDKYLQNYPELHSFLKSIKLR